MPTVAVLNERSEATAAKPTIADRTRFSMRGVPLLKRGATMDLIGTADNLWAHSKVYSNGGENALHLHVKEDHMFFVLQGGARFDFGDSSSCDIGPLEGIMLPKGTTYKFRAHEGQNLVMMRVGGGQVMAPNDRDPVYHIPTEIVAPRVGTDGKTLNGSDERNGTPAEPTEYLPGAFFGLA